MKYVKRYLDEKSTLSGRKGRGSMDSVLLADKILWEAGDLEGTTFFGRDIQAASNSVDRQKM